MIARRLIVLAALAAVAGCQGAAQEAERVALGADPAVTMSSLAPELQVHIDAGNAAYRTADYAEAMRHYREAAALAPDEPTAWFGVAMAAAALEDDESAEAAQQRVHELAPALGMGVGHGEGADAGSADPAYGGPGSAGHP
jgi:tetratricopeptide (TPR) repeat protein